MSIIFAYFAVTLIWMSTPLAVQWSSDAMHYSFMALARIALAACLASAFLYWRGQKLPWDRQALKVYAAGCVGMFGATFSMYWVSRFVPSGLIAVFMGAAPTLTGLLSLWLFGVSLRALQWVGLILALSSLALLYIGIGQIQNVPLIAWGVLFASIAFHSLSALWVKHIPHTLSPFIITTGSLWLSSPLFFMAWLYADAPLPSLTPDVIGLILYTAVICSFVGFLLYFFLLEKLAATTVSLNNLIVPVGGLWLGYQFNGETLSWTVLAMTGFILVGLALYLLPQKWRQFAFLQNLYKKS